MEDQQNLYLKPRKRVEMKESESSCDDEESSEG